MNIQLLKNLVSIPSEYPNEHAICQFMVKQLKTLGFQVLIDRIASKRFNILATYKSHQNPKILFYGHLDTVNSSILPGWKTNPYSLTRQSDKLLGLGSVDMKGGVFAFITAITQTNKPAKIILAVDEENISQGSWSIIKNHSSFFSNIDLIISAEPNFGLGDNSITTSRTGRYLFDLSIHGKSSHIAQYKKGIDAIDKSSQLITSFYKKRDRLFKSSATVAQVRYISSEAIGMSVSALTKLQIEVLSSSSDTKESLAAILSEHFTTPVSLHPRQTPYLPGYSFSNIPYLQLIRLTINKHLHQKTKIVSRSSVADDNVLATLKIPVITWGPSGANAHGANEFVSYSSLTNFVRMYSDLLLTTESIL
jgi:succinyl-diaminopimelate desuccinylase